MVTLENVAAELKVRSPTQPPCQPWMVADPLTSWPAASDAVTLQRPASSIWTLRWTVPVVSRPAEST